MKKEWLWFFFFLIFLESVSATVIVNEIMYNPSTDQGDDSKLEWIELFNNESEMVNLSNWTINGNGFDDVTISGGGYVVVARNLLEFNLYYGGGISVVDGSFSLGNSGGSIDLSDGNNSWSIDYNNEEANGNGKSLEWTRVIWDESLLVNGTPGRVNSKDGFSGDYSLVEISEVMPDPLDNDDEGKPLGEWVELYNPTDSSIDLSGLVIFDSNDANELYISDSSTTKGTVIPAEEYLVVYRNGDSDFALNNNGYEEVRFYDCYPASVCHLIDSMSYSGSTEGMSWSKIEDGWYKTPATLGGDNAMVAGCDWQVDVQPSKSIYNEGEQVGWEITVSRNYGEAGLVSVEGYVEDVFGRVVKSYKPWTNESITTQRTKSYTPNLADEVYNVKFEITDLDCSDNNLGNNNDEELITINPYYKVNASSLKIETVYLGNDDEAEWGDRIRAKVNIYKGDETRYNVELYVEDDNEKKVSKTTKTSAHDKFTNYTLTLPVQLEPNCDHYYLDGDYTLVLEGLGERVEEEIEINDLDDEVCQETGGKDSVRAGGFSFEITEKPDTVEAGQEFDVKIEIEGDDEEHEIKVWSYLYKGPKCYSGDREENVKEMSLGIDEVQIVDLKIMPDEDLEPGDYKLKVKLNKDNQKTDKEITDEVTVGSTVNKCVVDVDEGASVEQNFHEKLLRLEREKYKQGKVIYQSSSERAGNWVPGILVGVFVLLCLILICQKPLMK
ncbi:lamin tail domain-containing protein [Nanoarchaeota archaeon]